MNKKPLVALIFVFFLFYFSSCKKCTTCEIQNVNGETEAAYDEFCGTNTEIENFIDDLEISAEQLGGVGTVVCTSY
ncbi:MAG: hypothetical protein HN704_05455 [Bacteroidetes bacterium]|jgi:hypothetical protein|nr:hypothetical protein [Bacteroidota bacterium]MBT6685660.1 hypothetical protein [Bacteroidota bacterium]MBT7141884.1 hypothetical protein [Bacteroidota bacterium]MBT7491039.1 hypothetical protein [Bacteroidota bacterium]